MMHMTFLKPLPTSPPPHLPPQPLALSRRTLNHSNLPSLPLFFSPSLELFFPQDCIKGPPWKGLWATPPEDLYAIVSG